MQEIPNYQKLYKPLLEFYSDNKEHELREAINYIVGFLGLTPDQRASVTSSGQPVIDGRVGWAHTYLRQGGLMRNIRRGVYVITDRGVEALRVDATKLNNDYLMQFPEFIEFKNRKGTMSRREESSDVHATKEDATPQERISAAIEENNQALTDDLLEALRASDPFYFEQIVADLLSIMGYGEAKVTQRTNDGGIDAIVNEDTLGLSKIYVQAKRYAADIRVNRKELRDFVGALEMNGVSKGVFITTSFFHNEAFSDLRPTSKSIILVDGAALASLMIRHNVGVATEKTFELKKLESDYFSAE